MLSSSICISCDFGSDCSVLLTVTSVLFDMVSAGSSKGSYSLSAAGSSFSWEFFRFSLVTSMYSLCSLASFPVFALSLLICCLSSSALEFS